MMSIGRRLHCQGVTGYACNARTMHRQSERWSASSAASCPSAISRTAKDTILANKNVVCCACLAGVRSARVQTARPVQSAETWIARIPGNVGKSQFLCIRRNSRKRKTSCPSSYVSRARAWSALSAASCRSTDSLSTKQLMLENMIDVCCACLAGVPSARIQTAQLAHNAETWTARSMGDATRSQFLSIRRSYPLLTTRGPRSFA